MTRKILIEIPGAGEVMCDKCRFLEHLKWTLTYYIPHCPEFDTWGQLDCKNMPRPQACLDAERAADKEGGK